MLKGGKFINIHLPTKMSHRFLWIIIILISTFRYDIAALREHITTKLAELSVIEEEVVEVSSIFFSSQYLCLTSEVSMLVVQSQPAWVISVYNNF